MKTSTSGLRTLLEIFVSFFKIGPLTFGGGYAMIPVIEREIVTRRKWIRTEDIGELLSIAGTAPGGIGVNAAAIVGYRLAGVWGAVIAVTGITIPTFLIVLGLSVTFVQVEGNPKIAAAFEGIHMAIVAMIAYAAYRVGRSAVFDATTWVTAIATVAVLLFMNANPFFVILSGFAVGIILVKVKEKLGLPVLLDKKTESKGQAKRPVTRFDDYFIGDGI